jgi:hypothetical protein
MIVATLVLPAKALSADGSDNAPVDRGRDIAALALGPGVVIQCIISTGIWAASMATCVHPPKTISRARLWP